MTITEYLQNPYGKGSAISGGMLQKIKEDIYKDYDELQSRFAARIYKYQNKAVIHVVVPSKKKPNITYDVVFEFKLGDIRSSEVTVENAEFKVFSNCPSFIFTYAHAFEDRGLIIKWLDNKYRKEVRKNIATTKNASNIIGMERSLYLACIYLRKMHYTDLGTINTISNKVSGISQIALNVRTQDQVMQAVHAKIENTPEVTTPPKGSPNGPLITKKSGDTRQAVTKAISNTSNTAQSKSTKRTSRTLRTKSTKRI